MLCGLSSDFHLQFAGTWFNYWSYPRLYTLKLIIKLDIFLFLLFRSRCRLCRQVDRYVWFDSRDHLGSFYLCSKKMPTIIFSSSLLNLAYLEHSRLNLVLNCLCLIYNRWSSKLLITQCIILLNFPNGSFTG